MRTALVLLFLLAVASVPGSVLPQRGNNPLRVDQWLTNNATAGPILDRLGFFDGYSSPWFSSVYLLLFLSLIGCLLPRCRQHWRAVRSQPPPAPRRLTRLPGACTLDVGASPREVLDRAERHLRRGRWRLRPGRDDDGAVWLAAERGYLHETGNLVFHLSLLLGQEDDGIIEDDVSGAVADDEAWGIPVADEEHLRPRCLEGRVDLDARANARCLTSHSSGEDLPRPGSDHALLSTVLTDGDLAEPGGLGDIAETYGLDLHQARLVITLGWFAPEPQPGQRYGAPLDETLVRDAIETRGLTLRQAAAELGADRKTVSRRCHELSIDLDTPGRRRTWLVDRDWLHHQYVDRGRPLPDIAVEVGCSPANMARIAKEHGIPLRSRGGVSHRSATVVDADLPPLLAACIRGQGGRERVERFAQIASCRSLNQATQLTGTTQSVLSIQLQKLEASAGGPLIVRSSKGHQPLRVTPLGRKLLKQSIEVLGLPAVTAVPEPLATALRSFRGEERIAKLVTASNEPTLRAGADACGLTPESLRRSIQGLEASTGRLVRRLALDESLRLTSKGATLVAQWVERHAPCQ